MFHIHHSNRSEYLLESLAQLCADAPVEPFTAETIVVQNPGMARWLALGIAEHNGIAANLDFPLLASFVWRIYAVQLDRVPERSPFDREILLWRLMALLPDQLQDPSYAPLRLYLRGANKSQRRFQLAQRIADLFDQYLVFRPELVLAWEDGAEDHWQARLWRALCAGERPRHRARLFAEFADRVRAGSLQRGELPARVSLFGLTAIPPAYVDVLRGLAEIVDVHLFVLNPSLDYWGDIVDERSRARLRHHRARHKCPGEADYLHVGNPLLASMGQQARDFIDLLHEGGGEHHEYYVNPERLDMLGLIQLDILLLQSRGAGCDSQPPVQIPVDDRSVQVHSAHSRMREVQVLHDRLLALFETLPALTTRDIVVMAPEIDVYAPYVEAVFGAVPPERRIPWSIADRRTEAELPIAATLMALLGLPQSRFAASEVLVLLEDAAIMRRLGMDELGIERVRRWVRESNIRWGIDGAMRAELGLPAEETTTWAFGLRRLLLGYAMPADAESPIGGIAPYADVEGAEARELGLLADFIDHLAIWRKRLTQPRDAAEWVDTLGGLLDDFFLPDEEEARFLHQVREALANLRAQCIEAGFQESLELMVVRDFLRGQLETGRAGQTFLDGRVSFCNMVPMRSIPFRVVCLLGMNDGEYPRVQRPLSFDLMAEQPRRGDRSRREDDRYLFLEALLSAREVLYISYIGRDIRSNTERVPSVLVSELLETVQRGFRVHNDNNRVPDIVTKHPLQPFSPRNFVDEGPLFSYAGEWLQDPRQAGVGAFIRDMLPEPMEPERELELDDLIDFLMQPARYLLERRLGVDLREFNERMEDIETFALDQLGIWKLKSRALDLALAGGDMVELRRQMAAGGGLPSADFGELAFNAAIESVPAFAEILQEGGVGSARESLELDLDMDGCRLRGWLSGVGMDGLLVYRVGKLRARDRLKLWLQHLALNVLAPDHVKAMSSYLTEQGTLHLGPVPNASTHLQNLIELYREGWRIPLPFFAESSLAYAEQRLRRGESAQAALEVASRVWQGNPYSNGEGSDPYYCLAFRGQDPLNTRFELLALSVFQPLFAAEREAGC